MVLLVIYMIYVIEEVEDERQTERGREIAARPDPWPSFITSVRVQDVLSLVLP